MYYRFGEVFVRQTLYSGTDVKLLFLTTQRSLPLFSPIPPIVSACSALQIKRMPGDHFDKKTIPDLTDRVILVTGGKTWPDPQL